MDGRLDGRVALVTGAQRNIGAAIARRLGAEGAAVAVNHPDEGSRADAEEVVAEISAEGARAIAVRADVSDERAVGEMVARVTADLGAPDVLVNNAAIFVARDVSWDADAPEEWDRVFRVNVTGSYMCARAVVPGMKARGEGVVVNISSITPLVGYVHNLPYVASKAALLGLTRSLARELGPDGIRVNAVLPGAISTPQQEQAFGGDLDPEVASAQALKRQGIPADVAGVVAFLASPDASFITGQSLVVDAGWVMPS